MDCTRRNAIFLACLFACAFLTFAPAEAQTVRTASGVVRGVPVGAVREPTRDSTRDTR